jgi:hypothetical protein
MQALNIAALAAGAPFLVDNTLTSLNYWDGTVSYHKNRLSRSRILSQIRRQPFTLLYAVVVISSVLAWYALSGYTFARVARNWDK